MGALPGYQTWGVGAVVLFVVLRFAVGICIGGEYTGASTLAMETTPRPRRGLYGAIVQCGFPVSYLAAALTTFVVLRLAPSGGVGSAYSQWGWRIGFFVAGALAGLFLAYFIRNVEESATFEKAGGSASPLRDLVRGKGLRDFAQVFVTMSGFWFSIFMVTNVLPSQIKSALGASDSQKTLIQAVMFVAVTLAFLCAGPISQRIGRRRFLMICGATGAIPGAALFGLLFAARPHNLVLVTVVAIVIAVLVISNWGITTVYISERFRTGVRASGFGLGYSLSVVIPSFYAFYQTGLSSIMPSLYTAIPLIALGGILITAGAALGPETRDVDMGTPATQELTQKETA
jgi:MFS family permease